MIKLITPPYGTALKYGFGFPIEPPMWNALPLSTVFGRRVLENLTATFLEIGADAELSIDAVVANTMRCSQNFIGESNVDRYNEEAVRIAREAIKRHGRKEGIQIFGDLSVAGNCYPHPSEPSSVFRDVDEAVRYHFKQGRVLKELSVDVLWAETIGNITEAQAFAIIAHELGLPVYISFILDDRGNVLDGTTIDEAVAIVDGVSDSQPLKYLSNCSSSHQVEALYQRASSNGVLSRLGGFYNNAANIEHHEKDSIAAVQTDGPARRYIDWVLYMLERFPRLQSDQNVWVSGCCGHTAEGINQLIREIVEAVKR